VRDSLVDGAAKPALQELRISWRPAMLRCTSSMEKSELPLSTRMICLAGTSSTRAERTESSSMAPPFQFTMTTTKRVPAGGLAFMRTTAGHLMAALTRVSAMPHEIES